MPREKSIAPLGRRDPRDFRPLARRAPVRAILKRNSPVTKRHKPAHERMSPEQRAAVDRIRVEHASPGYRAEDARVRERVMEETPPRTTPSAIKALAALRLGREHRGLSLYDVADLSGIERSALSKLETGKTNPTLTTLDRYAGALGMRLQWSLVEDSATK